MQTALKPDLFLNFKELGKVEEPEEVANLEEQHLRAMCQTTGWEVLKTYINNLMNEMDALNQNTMASGASFEEIGRNSVVIQLCKEQLQKVIDRVEDVREEIKETEE